MPNNNLYLFQNLKSTNIQTFNLQLSEALKAYLIAKAPTDSQQFLRGKLKPITIDVSANKDKKLTALIHDVLLLPFANDAQTKKLLEGLALALQSSPATVVSVLQLNVPLKENPIFRADYLKAKAQAFGGLIGISAAAIEKLSANDFDAANEKALDQMVHQHLISQNQKKGIILIKNLSLLTGENLDLIKALHANTESIESLAAHDADDWKTILTHANIPLPHGEKSIDSYARALAKNMELSFPQEYFIYHIVNPNDLPEKRNAIAALDKIGSLGTVHYEGSHINLSHINWSGISYAEKVSLQNQMQSVQELAHQYKYLNIGQILAENTTLATKQAAIAERLRQLHLFYDNNKTVDFSIHYFFDAGHALNFSGVDESNKPLIRAQAMANQRMLRIAEDVKTTRHLLSAGFSSAADIVKAGEKHFVSTSGLEANAAKNAYKSALNTTTATSHFIQATRDMQRGGFRDLAVNNLALTANDLRDIDGYDTLFGSQNFCDCDHCRSIFSPAAYFSDLMLFINNNVTRRFFQDPLGGHPLNLKMRRPDLWTVPLTCQNTATEIPYLDVVNDVLEKYLALGHDDLDIYEMLASSEASCALPFNLRLEEARLYLSHFGYSLSDICILLDLPEEKSKQEKLSLSDQELAIILTADATKALQRFGNPDLADFPVSEFTRLAGIARHDLDALLEVKSISGLHGIEIQIKNNTENIQQFTEIFKAETLTAEKLDLMQRFLKLWKKLPWSIPEFDMILGAMKHSGNAGIFEEGQQESVLILADLETLQSTLRLTVEELCAIIDELPENSLQENEAGLYSRLFNLKEILAADTENIVPYLLSGLSVNEQELNSLFAFLEIDSGAMMNKQILSGLYQMSRLAVALKLSIADFMLAIAIVGNGAAETIAEILELISHKRRLDETPFTYRDVDFILNGNENQGNKYNYKEEDVERLLSGIKPTMNAEEIRKELQSALSNFFNFTERELEGYLKFATVKITDLSAHPENSRQSSQVLK